MTEPEHEKRSAARLILLDAARRVLLLRHTDGHGREFWATPGGGIEQGETAERAARREATEELGIRSLDLVLLWTGHTDFRFANRRVSQDETFFRVTRHDGVLVTDVADAHREEGILEFRWWSTGELETTDETVFPTDLAERIASLR